MVVCSESKIKLIYRYIKSASAFSELKITWIRSGAFWKLTSFCLHTLLNGLTKYQTIKAVICHR